MVTVTVTAVRDDVVEVRLADGRAGVIARREFGSSAPPVGAEIDAALLNRDDPRRVWLSHLWAAKDAAVTRLREAHESRRLVSGQVQRVVRGGLVVDIDGARGFLPASLVDEHPVEDLAALVGETVEVAVVEVDPEGERVVVSRRDALRRQRRAAEKEIFARLSTGSRVRGTVVSIREFGAQIDLGGGVRGLLHRSELRWGRVGSVAEIVEVGQELEVIVTEVNRSKRRVGLSLRRLTPDPLEGVEVGQVAEAEITEVVDFGAFARLLDGGAEGLIHTSELSDLPGQRPDRLVAPGDRVTVKVIEVDRDRHRLGLSIRQAMLA